MLNHGTRYARNLARICFPSCLFFFFYWKWIERHERILQITDSLAAVTRKRLITWDETYLHLGNGFHGFHAHGRRVGTRWTLRSLPAWTTVWLYETTVWHPTLHSKPQTQVELQLQKHDLTPWSNHTPLGGSSRGKEIPPCPARTLAVCQLAWSWAGQRHNYMVNYHNKAAQSSDSYRFSKVRAGNHGFLFPADTQGETAPEAVSEECHIGQLLKHLQPKI